ncbi:hypothetical protein SISNIDRAFT_490358 [Sistotremastrum niveocremeum HHB9708]|uniref:Uncharacterized protein n=1 Tax=Sistotremastrum niveocremeum HHB9708 TaxID=1314777 RepID=A0A164NYN3_9AGAM|nr:hypothetical protein SISNIDRAFT_490358 [Sistotremastrum niveocremeum HHB9708]
MSVTSTPVPAVNDTVNTTTVDPNPAVESDTSNAEAALYTVTVGEKAKSKKTRKLGSKSSTSEARERWDKSKEMLAAKLAKKNKKKASVEAGDAEIQEIKMKEVDRVLLFPWAEEDPDPNKVLLSPTGINLLGRHRLVHKLDNGKRLLLDTSASAIQLANWFIALFPEARDWLLDNYTLPNPNALSLLRPAKRFGTLVDPVPQDVEFTAAHFLATNRAPYVLVMRPYQTIPRDVWEQFGVEAGSAKEKAVEDNAVAGPSHTTDTAKDVKSDKEFIIVDNMDASDEGEYVGSDAPESESCSDMDVEDDDDLGEPQASTSAGKKRASVLEVVLPSKRPRFKVPRAPTPWRLSLTPPPLPPPIPAPEPVITQRRHARIVIPKAVTKRNPFA